MEAAQQNAPNGVAEAVASRELWYHTMELAPGVVTPGWFDLRPIVDKMPWPDVRSKRCLDVGPWDGFLTFELERRGAAEVVAADIASPADWDMPILKKESGAGDFEAMAGENGEGFRIARDALGSKAKRVDCSIYDLSPERVGMFDVVVCGSLLLHLRDPIRGLEALRSVCDEAFLSAETVSLGLSLVGRGRPLARFRAGERGQWIIPNAAGHRAMLESAGFAIERSSKPYAIPLGPAHPSVRQKRPTLSIAMTGSRGVPHVAVLATPVR